MKPMMLALLMFASGCDSNHQLPQSSQFPNENAALVASARKVVEGLEDRRMNGEALTLDFIGMQYVWSRRLAEAERDAATNDAERLAALQRHLRRMEESGAVLNEHRDAYTDLFFRMIEYYVAEAKLWIAQTEKGQSVR